MQINTVESWFPDPGMPFCNMMSSQETRTAKQLALYYDTKHLSLISPTLFILIKGDYLRRGTVLLEAQRSHLNYHPCRNKKQNKKLSETPYGHIEGTTGVGHWSYEESFAAGTHSDKHCSMPGKRPLSESCLKATEMFLIRQRMEHTLLDQLLSALKSMVSLQYFAGL